MSELVLVRHGKASFGSDSYDKLSDTGREQVRLLAKHWADLGESFDHLYSGTLRRQQETAAELRSLLANPQQQISTEPAFNEYEGEALIASYLRDHAGAEGYQPGLSLPIAEERLYQRVFEAATAKWLSGELNPAESDHGFEHWTDFQSRVFTAIDTLMARHQKGSRVLIATSGGVIALTLQRVLGFADHQAIATNWMVHNSSVSRIRYGNGKVSLTLFNSVAHLEKPELRQLVTFR